MRNAHPFEEIEARLAAPPATGVLLTVVTEGSSFEAAGARAGDILTAIVDGPTPPTRRDFFESMRATGEGQEVRKYNALGLDGSLRELSVTLPVTGVSVCGVQKGARAWDADVPDSTEFDFDALADGLEINLRNSLEETRSGFEILRLARRGDLLDVEVLFRLGGDAGEGQTWDHRTRTLATLRLAPGLPAIRTAHWQGGRLVGDLRLEDGVWRGVKSGSEGKEVAVERPATAPVCPGYVSTLLPLTLPLEEGAAVTVCSAGDGVAIPVSRERFRCLGRRTTTVAGEEVEAWCFTQDHYGPVDYGDAELYFVTDERRLVRVEWGSNYAGCWAEEVPFDELLDGVPPHVTLDVM